MKYLTLNDEWEAFSVAFSVFKPPNQSDNTTDMMLVKINNEYLHKGQFGKKTNKTIYMKQTDKKIKWLP